MTKESAVVLSEHILFICFKKASSKTLKTIQVLPNKIDVKDICLIALILKFSITDWFAMIPKIKVINPNANRDVESFFMTIYLFVRVILLF